MSEFWRLIKNVNTDHDLLRVYRWLLQWPEAWFLYTWIDPSEASRSTGIPVERVVETLRLMAAEKYLEIYHERPDGVMWVVVVLNREQEAARRTPQVVKPPKPKVPPERLRTPDLKLRWKILQRDGNRCRACGATVEDGSKLVIDHIKPYSKGGLTVEENLQTLCFECNSGKYDQWLELA